MSRWGGTDHCGVTIGNPRFTLRYLFIRNLENHKKLVRLIFLKFRKYKKFLGFVFPNINPLT